MDNVEKLETVGQKAIRKAKEEVEESRVKKAVGSLKKLYEQEVMAQTALDNIKREIEDLEAAIEQGNLDG